MLFCLYFGAFALFSIIFTREVIAPASGATCDKRWRLYAGGLNAANLVVVAAAGFLFKEQIAQHSLFGLASQLDPVTGSFLTFLAASLVAYWYHRAVHHSDRLWRWIHQLHHSPSRIEALTAFYVHPFDGLAATLLNAVVAYVVLGVGAESATLALFYVVAFNLIAHADLRSPWWLGFLVQRPEMHRVHHERGVHASNYGLPVFDLMFGTWRNPRSTDVVCGFAEENERRVGDMLMLRDVGG